MILKSIGIKVYNKIPSNLKNSLGKLSWLKPLRDQFFRKNGRYKEVETLIKRTYQNYTVEFKFLASFQVSAKATTRGVESTLLNNSITLINKYKPHANDLTVLDVGANFGFLSLVWANTIAKNGQTIAFEPNSSLYRTISKSIKLNDLENTLSVVNNAVGNENKTIKLFIGNATSNVIKMSDSSSECEVEMTTLDGFCERSNLKQCDLLKIDVDGIELDILKGATQLIKRFKPLVIIETNENIEIIEYIKMLDYTVLDMGLNEFKESDVLPLNVFCVSNESYL